MFLSVAPSAPSMPSERSRRCASTVKPPTATRAMSSMPTVASASTMVLGLSGLLATASCRVTTYGRREPSEAAGLLPAGTSNSTVTWLGVLTWPGATRANSSSRLCGFCTMPMTWRICPPWCHMSPTVSLKVAATPWVTATWPGPAG